MLAIDFLVQHQQLVNYKLPAPNEKGTAWKTFTFRFFKTMWFSKINLNLGTNRK